MDDTDTYTQLETLQRGLDDHEGRRRPGWAAAAVALAVAAVVVVVMNILEDDTHGSVTPAAPVDGGPVEIARGFVDAFAAYDSERADHYLADGARLRIWAAANEATGLQPGMRWSQAARFQVFLGACEEQPASTAATVVCSYDMHGLGSDDLDRGPFSDNKFTFTIGDGKILAADLGFAYSTNGFSTFMWNPFASWVSQSYPDDAALMYSDWPSTTMEATDARSAELWARHVADYVRAVHRGTAD